MPFYRCCCRRTVARVSARRCPVQGVKFGCYAPMTGQLAIFGKSMQSGFEMAIDEFQKSPQAKGIKFSIQCEDDQGRADDGINLARKFIEDKSVLLVLGSWSSTVTLAAAPVYNEGKLVNITPISSHPDVTKAGPYVFRQSLVQSQEGAFNGASLWKLGARKIAMLGIPNDYGKANMAFTRRASSRRAARSCSRSSCDRMRRTFVRRCKRRRAKIRTGSTSALSRRKAR